MQPESTAPSTAVHGFRPDIQGLRAVAVLSVVAAHARVPGVTGGFVGVDVFFVISGFLITGLLLGAATKGSFSLQDFYARRARRILPAASLVILCTMLASRALLSSVRATDALRDGIWATFFAANIKLARDGTDYFSADEPPSVFQHYWSLAVEEQFYLVWPLLLGLVLLGVRWRRRHLRTEAPRTGAVSVLLLVIIAASLAYSVALTRSEPTAAYFSAFTRAWELAIGALLATQVPRLAALPLAVRAVTGWVGLGCIAAAVFTFDSRTAFPGWAALFPVLGSALVIAAGTAPTRGGAGELIGRQPLRWVGDISYSLYLWHWPVLRIAEGHAAGPLSATARVELVLLSLLLAAVTYAAVENPFRRAKSLEEEPQRAMSLWPASVIVLLVVSQLATLSIPQPAPAADPVGIVPETGATPAAGAPDGEDPILRAVEAAAAATLAGGKVPDALSPTLSRLRDDRFETGPGCVAQTGETTSRICTVGDVAAARSLLLIGDSHASMWLPALDLIGRQGHVAVSYLVKNGCTVVDVHLLSASTGRASQGCDQWRDWAVSQAQGRSPDAILVASRVWTQLADDAGQPIPASGVADAWVSGVGRTLTALKGTGKLFLLGDPHPMDKNPIDCLSRAGATLRDCSVELTDDLHTQLDFRSQLATKDAGAAFVDVAPWFCSQHICPMVVGSTIAFRDVEHITSTYARALATPLGRALQLELAPTVP